MNPNELNMGVEIKDLDLFLVRADAIRWLQVMTKGMGDAVLKSGAEQIAFIPGAKHGGQELLAIHVADPNVLINRLAFDHLALAQSSLADDLLKIANGDMGPLDYIRKDIEHQAGLRKIKDRADAESAAKKQSAELIDVNASGKEQKNDGTAEVGPNETSAGKPAGGAGPASDKPKPD